MKTVKVESMRKEENPHGVDARKLYDTEKVQVIHILLNPGERLKRHITKTDVLFYVLEGEGIVEIGDERKTVEKDTLVESPSGIPHCWYNESERVLRFLVMKIPRPAQPTQLL